MITHNLGYPRIGNNRELKKACESYWDGRIGYDQLLRAGSELRQKNWMIQKNARLDLIPSNDFSYYDHVLDMTFTTGAIPDRYSDLEQTGNKSLLDLYFAMARGVQKDGFDITAMEMTKWFDTNYHYIVTEFTRDQEFRLYNTKIIDEFLEAKSLGILTKPVLIGPVSFLLLGKGKDKDLDKLELLPALLPVYHEIVSRLKHNGVEWIQFDEPYLAMDLDQKAKESFTYAYSGIRKASPGVKVMLATYFEGLRDNTELAFNLPVDAVHVDLVRDPEQLERTLTIMPGNVILSMGVVDGRNIWKNDFMDSLKLIRFALNSLGSSRVMIAPSCSLLHSPCDLEMETNDAILPGEIRSWMSFARQKIDEVVSLKQLASDEKYDDSLQSTLLENQMSVQNRKNSGFLYNEKVRERLKNPESERTARSPYSLRKEKQQNRLNLPPYPTTTIGSFPQTGEVRNWRAKLKKKEITEDEYNKLIKNEISGVIKWQEEVGLDVLVHGEFERNDMVEYFGEKLNGFAFTANGWVQSYGSRCVKPPVIFGDVSRDKPMTVKWIKYAQSLTGRPVKGMLTGPVTILEWSFVRDDQPVSLTCMQIALAINDEVLDLEEAGIAVIQIDEPALREGLPLRKADWQSYLDWAVRAFRLSYSGVRDETQIHTHMCYSEFNDIMQDITALDADVITIECSRSQMELLDVFAEFKYPNDIGPGVYDIHSPRVPAATEMIGLLKRAAGVIPREQLWVNPDCGLKTRKWSETRSAVAEMVKAAIYARETL